MPSGRFLRRVRNPAYSLTTFFMPVKNVGRDSIPDKSSNIKIAE
jgi:hypothetical protein